MEFVTWNAWVVNAVMSVIQVTTEINVKTPVQRHAIRLTVVCKGNAKKHKENHCVSLANMDQRAARKHVILIVRIRVM